MSRSIPKTLFAALGLPLLLVVLAAPPRPVRSEAEEGLRLSGFAAGALPLGADASVFTFGYGGGLEAGFPLALSGRLTLAPSLAFGYAPLVGVAGTGIASLELRAALRFEVLRLGPVAVSAVAGGGGYAAFLNGRSAFNPALSGGLSLDLRGLAAEPSLGLSYRALLGLSGALELRAGVGFALAPSPAQAGGDAAPNPPATGSPR
ncbi:MAG: hypothetical protein JNG85_15050, partial [Spirochaetaceae bacterium]|nr:hypothetical protein [Spirochaetaceae bacterium]